MSYPHSGFLVWSGSKSFKKTLKSYVDLWIGVHVQSLYTYTVQGNMENLRSIFRDFFYVKINLSIKRKSIIPGVIDNCPVLVSAVPGKVRGSGDWRLGGKYLYMCSTPSLPSLTACSTSLTTATTWKSVPLSVDLITIFRPKPRRE